MDIIDYVTGKIERADIFRFIFGIAILFKIRHFSLS